MGVKAAALAGLLLPLLLLLFFISPLVDGVYQCSDLTKSDFMSIVNCEVGQDKYCFAVKCKKAKEDGKAEAYGCGGIDTRLDACKDLDKKYCSSKEGIKKGPEGCQLCTGEKCNTGKLEDGGDWDNPDHKEMTTTSSITTTTKKRPATITTTKKGPATMTTTKKGSATSSRLPPTTTTKKATAKPTDKGTNGGASESPGGEEEDGNSGGYFGVNSLLLIVASLLIGLISHSAILLR